jgi:hypothetical protein
MIEELKSKTQPVSKEQVWLAWNRIKQGGKGVYHFDTYLAFRNYNGTSLSSTLIVGPDFFSSNLNKSFFVTNGGYVLSGSATVLLKKGDTVEIRVVHDDPDGKIDIWTGSPRHYISGFLVHPVD